MTEAFKPLWWLKNAHLQTIFPTLIKKYLPMPKIIQQRVELADGDFLDLMWANGNLHTDSPLVMILHGMGGSIHSSYAKILMQALNSNGHRAVMLHFRSAGVEANRLPRTYHAGDTKDLDKIIEILNTQEPNTVKSLIGISLGGNVLLKWLGEQGQHSNIHKAIAVSVPFQLENLVQKMNRGFSKIYQKHLLRVLRKLYSKKSHQALPFDIQMLSKLKTFEAFDEVTTAPLHHFESAKHYYQSSSCVPYLKNIKVPTLIIHALDDPFMTKDCLPKTSELSDCIRLEISEHGGHVGFISQVGFAKPKFWLASKIISFLI
jgi:predicted alpha/beta-fold hydrolase